MTKFIFPLFLCAASLFSLTPLQARHVFKKYLTDKEITFRDGHFRIARPGEPLLKLKTLRANNAGIYYIPQDICKKKGLHRDHDNNKDSDILKVNEKSPEINEEKVRRPGRYRPDRRPHCPEIEEFSVEELEASMEKWHAGGCKNRPRHSEHQYTPPGPKGDGWHDRPEAGPNGPRGRYAVKEVEQEGPQGLPETFRHDHCFPPPGANGAAG